MSEVLSLADKIERQRWIKAATNAARAAFAGAYDDDAAAQLATALKVMSAARKAGCTSDDLKVARGLVAHLRAGEKAAREYAAYREAAIMAAVGARVSA